MASIKRTLHVWQGNVAIQQLLGFMEKGKGSSFWPKPMLHPFCLVDVETHVILVKPCGFYKT
jgi:hypothetical protein